MLITLPFWPNLGRNRTGARTTPKPYLNDEHWNMIADLFPEPVMTSNGGRPLVSVRDCLDPEKWRAMERFTRAAIQGMDRVRCVSRSLDSSFGDAP